MVDSNRFAAARSTSQAALCCLVRTGVLNLGPWTPTGCTWRLWPRNV